MKKYLYGWSVNVNDYPEEYRSQLEYFANPEGVLPLSYRPDELEPVDFLPVEVLEKYENYEDDGEYFRLEWLHWCDFWFECNLVWRWVTDCLINKNYKGPARAVEVES